MKNEEIEKLIESGELVKEIDFAKILKISRSLLLRYRGGFYIDKKKYNKRYIYEAKFIENTHYLYFKSFIYWNLEKKDEIISLLKSKAKLIETIEI